MATKKKQKKVTKPKPKAKAKKKGPRQTSLPGMEDRQISALQDAAMDYAEQRDARIAASASEVQAKKALLDLMHSYKKKRYVHGNVFIEIVPEGEKLKVKILEDGEEAPAAKDDEPEPDELDEAEEIAEQNEEESESGEELEAIGEPA